MVLLSNLYTCLILHTFWTTAAVLKEEKAIEADIRRRFYAMSLGHCHLMRAELGQLGKVQELKSCDFSLQLALNEGNQFKVAHAPARPWPWARLGTRSGPSGTNCCTLCCSCSDYECDTSDKWAKLLVTDVDCSGPHQCQHCQWIFFPSSPRWLSLDIPNLVNPVMKKSWS